MPFVTDRLAEGDSRGLQRLQPDRVQEYLRQGIVGQERAVEAIVRALAVAQSGLRDTQRPLASILLVGPTGVGKTEVIRRFSTIVRGSPDAMCRVDMSALAQEHYAASFSGAPPGYAGSKEGFSLFERDKIEGDPYTPGIVLFDEVEKANRTVLRALLHVLDHGVLRLSSGQTRIEFRNCYVFLTSNLGSRELSKILHGPLGRLERWQQHRHLSVPGTEALLRHSTEKITKRALRHFFDPEFLNRLDEVVVMNDLGPAATRAIVQLQVNELAALARQRAVEFHVPADVVDHVHRQGFSPEYGARSIRRAIRQHLTTPLAEAIARSPKGTPDQPLNLTAKLVAGEVCVVAKL